MIKLTSLILAFLAFVMSFFTASVFAAGPNMDTLTAAVDFSTVSAAVLTIFAALATVYVLIMGGKLVLARLRGR